MCSLEFTLGSGSAVVDGPGCAQVESLCEVHAFGPQQGQGMCVFDAFRDRLEAECAGQADYRFDDVQVGGVCGQVADELDIDFEVGDGQPFQVGEAAEAGSEVVEG